MAKWVEYNGHYCESEYEYAFIGLLEKTGWKYLPGNNIKRSNRGRIATEKAYDKLNVKYLKGLFSW